MESTLEQKATFSADAETVALPTHAKMRSATPVPSKSALADTQDRDAEAEAFELPVLTRGSTAASILVPPPPKSDAQMRKELRRERIALAALMFSMFMEGWNDGTSGPMLPAMQKHYKVSKGLYVSRELYRLVERLDSLSSH